MNKVNENEQKKNVKKGIILIIINFIVYMLLSLTYLEQFVSPTILEIIKQMSITVFLPFVYKNLMGYTIKHWINCYFVVVFIFGLIGKSVDENFDSQYYFIKLMGIFAFHLFVTLFGKKLKIQ